MIQLLQSLATGETSLVEVPVPGVHGPNILVEGRCSVVSAGTERMLVEFGRAGWLNKARQQPDKIVQVVNKARTDGVGPALEAVRSKLDTPIPLGYCHAGVVLEVGDPSLPFAPGDRVVSNGPHAECVAVPWTLSAKIPDSVSFEAAAFTPVAAIGLQGVRLADPSLGETVVVYGLGLIGLLTVQILRANGCRVIGIDTNIERLTLAEQLGAEALNGDGDIASRVLGTTNGVGADAVILTLASSSDDPIHHSALMSRKRGRIVLVGVTGLRIRRDDFYKKELSFIVSCSYGPGRYDPEYEESGRDYPLPYVRWTEQRNMEAVLQLMATGAVDPLPLVTHRFPLEQAGQAYDLITSKEPSLGVLLNYEERDRNSSEGTTQTIELVSAPPSSSQTQFSVAVIGAGNFASRILIPAIRGSGARLRSIASTRGTSASVAGRRFGFERVTSDLDQVFSDEAVDTVVIVTRHDSHAELTVRALEAGKNVFVEKPLALNDSELDRVIQAHRTSGRLLSVGFNRRFAPLAVALAEHLENHIGPVSLVVTVNAGAIPTDHWTQDLAIGGGRIIGEACHFVDLSRFLIGASIRDVSVTAAAARDDRIHYDIAHISIRFQDGSTAVVHYLANGSAAFPKERVEAFADGQIWQIDNWRRLKVFGGRGSRGHVFSRIEKGHKEELAAFAASVQTAGSPPIPYNELFEVSRWAIRAAERATHGSNAP